MFLAWTRFISFTSD